MEQDPETKPENEPTLRQKVFCWRTGIWCMEGVAVISLLAMFALVLTFWAITKNPIEIGFAKSYIEKALYNPERGVYGTMDKVVLHWPDVRGPLYLGLSNTKIVNEQGEVIVSVDEAAISLSKPKLLIGKIEPVAIILRKPALRVIRTEEDGFKVAFGREVEDKKPDLHEDDQTELTTRIFQYIARPGENPDESSPLASLRGFEVHEARLLVEDQVMGMTWLLPRFDISLMSTQQGLETSLYLELPDVNEKKSFIKGGFDMVWDTKDIIARTKFQNIDTKVLASKIQGMEDFAKQDVVLSGSAEAALDSEFVPKAGKVTLRSPAGAIWLDDLSTEPVPYKDFKFDAFYDGKTGQLDVSKLTITAKDVTVEATTKLTYQDDKISGPVKVDINDLPQERIGSLWPEALKDDNSRIWVVDNITGGTYTHAGASLNLIAQKDEAGEWDIDAQNVMAEFAFTDMDVNYRPPLTPVTQASGKGVFNYDEEKLTVTVDGAKLGDMDVPGTKVELVNIVTAGAGVANIEAKVLGSVPSVLAYASKEPISLGDKIDFDIAQTKGKADLDVKISLPTVADVQMEDVTIDISGTVSDVFVPDVVMNLPLSGGPMNLLVTNESAQVSGKGKLDGRAMDFTWMEYLQSAGKPHAGKITAKITADPALREHFGINLDEFLSGPVPVNVEYTQYADKKADAFVTADLTPAKLYFDPFDYVKEPGQPGKGKLKARLVNDNLVEVTGLTASAPEFTLEDSKLSFRQINGETEMVAGDVSRFSIGETVAAAEFQIEDNGQIKLSIDGPFLDLRPFLNEDPDRDVDDYDDPPLIASIAVDQMRTSKDFVTQYGKIYVDVNSEGQINQLEMDAAIGTGDMYLRYKPDDTGKRVFRLEADDAGAFLKAFKVYDKIVGGKLLVYAEPIRGVFDRNLIGKAEISNFKVVKAPGLAKLLGVLSLQGINDLLSNEGLTFTKLEADFDWLYRREGSLLVLKNGRTSGGSLGLTFDGVFDKGKGVVDASGTIVPMSELNSVIGSIPLLGDILTGGSGGVFAATYKIKGKAEEPEITVNPLSVLAPGIIRRILFE